MDHSCDWAGSRGTFTERLGKAVPLQQVGQSPQELADPNMSPVEVGNALEKDCAGKDAAE